jgi:hypothetical protein
MVSLTITGSLLSEPGESVPAIVPPVPGLLPFFRSRAGSGGNRLGAFLYVIVTRSISAISMRLSA